VGRRWTFGDGGASDERQPTHCYGIDGDYTVELTASTPDGRQGTATAVVEVRTHDVAIASLRAPASCRAGEPMDIVVEVSSSRYDEVVELRLFVRVPGSKSPVEQADRTAFAVRAGGARSATSVVLQATTPADAAGTVTIEAVVVILGGLDPTGSERSRNISIPVERKARGARDRGGA
jgi:PKD repeat protein